MASRPRPPGYHCSKALRRLGLEADAVSRSLRRRLGLDTGEIAEVLAYPITPPEGVATIAGERADIDITDVIDARGEGRGSDDMRTSRVVLRRRET